MDLRRNSNVKLIVWQAFLIEHPSVHFTYTTVDSISRYPGSRLETYIDKLDDEVPPLAIWVHGKDIFTRFPMALAYQEVSLLPQKLLGLYPRDCTMVPVMFRRNFSLIEIMSESWTNVLKTKLEKKKIVLIKFTASKNTYYIWSDFISQLKIKW